MSPRRVFVLLAALQVACSSDIFDLPCAVDDNCADVAGASCNTDVGSCFCPGYSIVDANMQRCLPVAAGAGSECQEDAQCSASMLSGGACIGGKCACVNGMHYHMGYCWTTKGVGEECAVSEECRALHAPDAVECRDQVCACAQGFYMREYTDCRPKATEVGGACALDFDCHVEGAYCDVTVSQCKCLQGPSEPGATSCDTPPSQQGTSQLVAAAAASLTEKPHLAQHLMEAPHAVVTRKGVGAECEVTADCDVNNAYCTPSGYCACARGFFVSSSEPDVCVPEIGGPCLIAEHCTVGNSTCSNGVCSCLVGFGGSATRKECLKQGSTIKRRCVERAECMLFGARAICKDQGSFVCDCEPTARYILSEQICWAVKGPGETCQDARDCYVTDGNQPVLCDQGMCKCWSGYHPSVDAKNCHIDAPALENKCTENADCSVANSQCTFAKCACKPGYFELKGACIIGVGGTCVAQTDCASVNMSVCTSSKCTCPAGHVASADITGCLPVGEGVGAACLETQQCTGALGNNAACTDGTCACAKKHHLALGQCVLSKGLGESCERAVECWLAGGSEGLVCRNYKCACDYEFLPSEDNDQCINSGPVSTVSSVLVLTLAAALLKLVM